MTYCCARCGSDGHCSWYLIFSKPIHSIILGIVGYASPIPSSLTCHCWSMSTPSYRM
jgi:hypothetical protein